MKSTFSTMLFVCIIFCLILLSQTSNAADDNKEIGLYGFYLGQSIQEVLVNAEKKDYIIGCGNQEIRQVLNNLPNGKNITSTGSALSEFPRPIINILGDSFKEIADKFENSYNKFAYQPDSKLNKYIFFTLFIEDDVNRPGIYIGMIWNKEENSMKVYQILINIYDKYNYDQPTEVINKIYSSLHDRYGLELLSEIKEGIIHKYFNNDIIVAYKNYKVSSLDVRTVINFYDIGIVKRTADYYNTLAKNLESTKNKKALEDI